MITQLIIITLHTKQHTNDIQKAKLIHLLSMQPIKKGSA